ncbi:hypothetical protein LTR97_009603 [Elasticomyces elasticus]|uniref:AB hydrolase-1 domain-containing protein n=1 Tax=Elasticomyces elasticus TaxID=574655 RepID=A0AAN7W0V9_9PEZI|nr:hypothetical protein LTR97_009603 [Elasticomyces elasticus]
MATYGPEVLYEGEEPIQADVVFVHGLGGDSLATWTKDDILWPKALLKERVPHARILTWGYDADPVHFLRQQGHQTILSHAQGLLADLKDMRESDEQKARPIIFVGHSLGGLVIKQPASHPQHTREASNPRVQVPGMTDTPDVPPPAYSATPSNPPPAASAFDIRDLLNALHSEHATSQASPGSKSPAPPLPRRKNEQVLDQATYKRVLELAIAIEGPCPPEKFQRFIDHYKAQNDWICSAESYKATFLPETFDPQSAESLSELLFLASCAGDAKVARAAISAGAEVDYVIPRLGDCALNAAFTFDHTEVIESLFEAGVSVLAVCTRQGINEQEYMARRLPMASPATVRQILSRRGKDALPSSAPLIAAQSCAVGVLQLLFEYEFDFMVQGAGGSSALHLAARQGQLENASYLLSIGYEVNILDTSQQTPLYDAIINCNTEAVKLLLDGGALVNIVDAAGDTPMHVLVVQPCASNGTPVQSEAIATIKIEIFLLLCAAGVMLNVANGKGQAPIHVAIKYVLSIMAALLLLAGASPDLTDANGWTPLHLCANGGNDHATIAAFLIEKGASLKARLPPPNPLTPFEVARHFANTTMMPLLRDAKRERGLAKWLARHGVA